jgi:hypothetical protein
MTAAPSKSESRAPMVQDPLAAKGLRYGQLIEVRNRAMRERYNRALEHLTGQTTALSAFHIDLSGFSPQVAEELGNPLYLNPHGVNKKFILLTTGQARLPALDTQFTSSATILKRFIADNREPLFALSTRDVVYGELQNSTYKIDSLADLLSINRIRVEVHTTKDIVAKAGELKALIARFREDDDAWHDEATLTTMVDLAKVTGDIRRHPVIPTKTEYAQPNYFANHFGGVYVFLDTKPPTLISLDPDFEARLSSGRPVVDHIALSDRSEVARFLADRKLIAFVGEGMADPAALLREKAGFVAYDALSRAGAIDAALPFDDEAFKRLIYDRYDAMPQEFRSLNDAVKALENDPQARLGTMPPDAFFYLVRSTNHADRELVNHLLAHFTPFDFRQSYICNRALFERQYAEWPPEKQAVVADYLGRHYAGDEAAVEDRLYGWREGPWGPKLG